MARSRTTAQPDINQTLKLINDDCTGNFELQMVVMSFIDERKQDGRNLKDSMKENAEKRKSTKLGTDAGFSPKADAA